MKESEKYQIMITKVESIIRSIDHDKVDLDEMLTKVEEGYKLIHKMRERLKDAKNKVEELKSQYLGEEESTI